MLEMIPQEGNRLGREPCFSLYHGYGREANRGRERGDSDGVIGSEMDLKREIKGRRKRERGREN